MKQTKIKWNDIRYLSLSGVLALFIGISIYSFLQQTTTTKTTHANHAEISTTYDYKATITPNVLNPAGGTVPVGETIVKKITTAIPIDMNIIVTSAEEVLVDGEHEVQLTVVAEDLWEKTFPLEQKQSLQKKGTTVSLIDGTYVIDLNKINAFITQAEDETGIIPTKYSLIVSPMVKGTIRYDGIEREILAQENLVFHYLFDSIVLASEKDFVSPVQFGTIETIAATVNILGFAVPVGALRVLSSAVSVGLLLLWIYINNMIMPINRKTQVELIHKKYGNRIISISGYEGIEGKSILVLSDIKSLLKIADEKELPVFQKQGMVGRVSYFIVDGNQLYKYEAIEEDSIAKDELWDEGSGLYVEK